MLTIITALIIFIVVFIKKNVNPVIIRISNEQIRSITTESVSNAVLEVMAKESGSDYLNIVRDEKGNIKSVDIDTVAVSALAQKITIAAQNNINAVGQDGIRIPLGSLSGVALFTGLGPDINIKIYLVGSTKTRIISSFSSSGINQTVHRLYLDISGSVAVAVPGLPTNISTNAQVLMSEMIIIGEVPPTYLDAVNVGDMLDLAVK